MLLIGTSGIHLKLSCAHIVSMGCGSLCHLNFCHACRALFGDQTECLTTLLAWQQMLNEAKWFGRALYDAEELLLQNCAHHMTEQ